MVGAYVHREHIGQSVVETLGKAIRLGMITRTSFVNGVGSTKDFCKDLRKECLAAVTQQDPRCSMSQDDIA